MSKLKNYSLSLEIVRWYQFFHKVSTATYIKQNLCILVIKWLLWVPFNLGNKTRNEHIWIESFTEFTSSSFLLHLDSFNVWYHAAKLNISWNRQRIFNRVFCTILISSPEIWDHFHLVICLMKHLTFSYFEFKNRLILNPESTNHQSGMLTIASLHCEWETQDSSQ